MLVINHEAVKTVDVVIGEKKYQVPLLSQLPYKEIKTMRAAAEKGEDATLEWGIGYISKYIPPKVVDTLRMSDIADIFNAVKLETEKDGPAVGES